MDYVGYKLYIYGLYTTFPSRGMHIQVSSIHGGFNGTIINMEN